VDQSHYIPSKRISVRETGNGEAWLQQLVFNNPAVLGLGELKALSRERKQSSGGRLDFLLVDPDSETMYEVELMLGATDESHIIRTLEYWDIESRRWPNREHRAVIVAEEITNRFFNVIWLLNRSLPIIAIKLDTLKVENGFVISFTKVLDIYEEPEGRDTPEDREATRREWESSNPESLGVFDDCVKMISGQGKSPRITYNAGHIAVGGQRLNFAWFTPRTRIPQCKFELRIGETNVELALEKLGKANIDSRRLSAGIILMRMTRSELKENTALIHELIELGIDEGGGL
jgi:hypothetical protein